MQRGVERSSCVFTASAASARVRPSAVTCSSPRIGHPRVGTSSPPLPPPPSAVTCSSPRIGHPRVRTSSPPPPPPPSAVTCSSPRIGHPRVGTSSPPPPPLPSAVTCSSPTSRTDHPRVGIRVPGVLSASLPLLAQKDP
eukprot:1187011-Prorocentrum_minimum.AAC.1